MERLYTLSRIERHFHGVHSAMELHYLPKARIPTRRGRPISSSFTAQYRASNVGQWSEPWDSCCNQAIELIDLNECNSDLSTVTIGHFQCDASMKLSRSCQTVSTGIPPSRAIASTRDLRLGWVENSSANLLR